MERDGVVKPEALVKDAKAKRHPMHNEFEWDDNKCGQYWRVHQARRIINHVLVDIAEIGMKAYEAVIPVENKDRSGYYPIHEIMSDDDLRGQVIKKAVNFIKYWQAKYKNYKELENLVNKGELNKLS